MAVTTVLLAASFAGASCACACEAGATQRAAAANESQSGGKKLLILFILGDSMPFGPAKRDRAKTRATYFKDDFTCDLSRWRGRLPQFRVNQRGDNALARAGFETAAGRYVSLRLPDAVCAHAKPLRGADATIAGERLCIMALPLQPQCRKWRIPVKTMAMPSLSAAAITS